MAAFKPPDVFVPGSFPAEEWGKWRRRFELYCAAADITSKPNAQQRAILLHVIGDTGFELFDTIEIAQEEGDQTIEIILDAITEHYNPYKNTTYRRYQFFTLVQAENQSIDEFVMELKSKAKDCEFGVIADSLIRDRLICGIKDQQLRERLLRESTLTLSHAVDICRADEVSKQQVRSIGFPKLEGQVNAISSMKTYNNKGNRQKQTMTQNFKKNSYDGFAGKLNERRKPTRDEFGQRCSRCLRTHLPMQCPAYGKICKKCNKINHFAAACRNSSNASVHAMEKQEIQCDYDDNLFLGSLFLEVHEVAKTSVTMDWTEKIRVCDKQFTFKIDSGSQVNILPQKLFIELGQSIKMEKPCREITAYSGHRLELTGICALPCEYRNKTEICEFYIVDTNAPAILGLLTSERFGILKRENPHIATETQEATSAELIVEEFSDLFTGIGCLPGKHKIRLKEGVIPKINAARKIPIGIQEKVKRELERMENNKIIQRVDEPTEWVHPIVIVNKPSGDIRICMDPRDLNAAILREHYSLPTVEEVFSKLQGSTHFTVLDAASAFWQVELDEPSSYICTFATPWGRYRFLRLPYGIKSAPEVFQKSMDRGYDGIDCSSVYFDDILVHGKGLQNHNQNLKIVLERSRNINIKFRKQKLQLAVEEINYIGHKISKHGIQVDPEKTKAIEALNSPTCKKELQRFMGMINYLAKFVPNLSSKTAYLRSYLKNSVSWTWDSQAQQEFDALKLIIASTPVLKFFDPSKPTTLSVDASNFGLGAVILQDNRPVAYASATLTEAQTRYAQIEKELLAVVYGCEHFHYYLYGRPTIVQTDHKPLLGIVKKPFDVLSPRLQRFVLRLQRYQLELIHVPGKELHIADALSRDPNKEKQVCTRYLEEQSYPVHMLVECSESKRKLLEDATLHDEELREVMKYVENGWPAQKNRTAPLAKSYWIFKDELHISNGLLLRGTRLVILKAQQKETLSQIHSAHQGIVACKAKARPCVFWIGMSADIERTVKECPVCQQLARANQNEPLKPHDIPNRPWECIGVDFMKLKGNDYVVVIDYFSKYIEIQMLPSCKATPVITALKSICARHGLPTIIRSDNGPPFDSYEFKNWTVHWSIKHVTSSPYYPKSNGMIERAIQTTKLLLKKAIEDGKDPYLVLLELRSTPQVDLPSPAEMLMGRKVRTPLPCASAQLAPNFDIRSMKETLITRQVKQSKYGNQTSKPLSELRKDQEVYVQRGPRNWVSGKITSVGPEPRTYKVTSTDGSLLRRNRIHLRPACIPAKEPEAEILAETEDANEVNPEINVSLSTVTQPEQTRTRSGRLIKPPLRYLDSLNHCS